jgi:hypothetical protein
MVWVHQMIGSSWYNADAAVSQVADAVVSLVADAAVSRVALAAVSPADAFQGHYRLDEVSRDSFSSQSITVFRPAGVTLSINSADAVTALADAATDTADVPTATALMVLHPRRPQ